MHESGRRRRAPVVGAGAWGGALALALGCASGGEFAKEMGGALGAGVLEGFAEYVEYQEDEWDQSWKTSGRGVGGLAPRSVAMPDCTGLEDESVLYVGPLLASPGSYVSTLDGEIDEAGFRSLAQSNFRLSGAREGGVIALLETTAGRHGRFVLTWDQRPHLHDLVVYAAETGETALRFEVPMPLAPHALVNLDPGEPEGFDLLFGPAPDGRLSLAAGEGAALSFPIESVCGG